MSDTSETKWHLDKRVPLAIIFGMFLQFGGFIWMVSQMRSDIDANTTWRVTNGQLVERLATLEERVAGVKDGVSELKDILLNGKDYALPK